MYCMHIAVVLSPVRIQVTTIAYIIMLEIGRLAID